VASFAYACNARDCTFDASASTDDVGIVSYAWAFGDGSSSASSSPTASNTYPANGNFGVTLEVRDEEGLSDTAVAVFRVKHKGDSSGSSDGGSGADDGTGGSEKGRKKCTDGLDNDGDDLIDGADPDC
jgi:PKD repeat protein